MVRIIHDYTMSFTTDDEDFGYVDLNGTPFDRHDGDDIWWSALAVGQTASYVFIDVCDHDADDRDREYISATITRTAQGLQCTAMSSWTADIDTNVVDENTRCNYTHLDQKITFEG